ncbi:MAG TPA: PAC2 family protein [Actinomycetota bacterium]|nr:PAC2 family protein [Actinomycetota bacterium]
MEASNAIIREKDVTLNKPILVAAFGGWNDAGDSATFAASHLARNWNTDRIASMDPEDFYDFQSTRPEVELVDGVTRRLRWPANEFSAATLSGHPHDVVVLIGTEPNLKWRTFAKQIVDFASGLDVQMVITLGALLADVPHSRPVQITGTAIDPELIDRLHLHRSRYEGPTGIVGVLHHEFAEQGIPTASLWAAVPHYLAVSPNPKAALALVEKTAELVGTSVAIDELVRATETYESRVAEVVGADDEMQSYVKMLEERADEPAGIQEAELPTGDELATELERFLRNEGTQ